MALVNVHDAKTHLSKLLRRVEAGEEILIARAGRPVARLIPATAPAADRVPGTAKGEVRIREDFDDGLPDDILGAFER